MSTTFTISQKRRVGTPAVQQAGIAVPANTSQIQLTAIMDAADITDPTKSIELIVERDLNDGAGYIHWCSQMWKGDPGNVGRFGGPASFICSNTIMTAFNVRVTVNIPVAMNLGVTVTLG